MPVAEFSPAFRQTQPMAGGYQERHRRAVIDTLAGQGEPLRGSAIASAQRKRGGVESLRQQREMPQPQHAFGPVGPVEAEIEFHTGLAGAKAQAFFNRAPRRLDAGMG